MEGDEGKMMMAREIESEVVEWFVIGFGGKNERCYVGIMEWSENEKNMDYGSVVGRMWEKMEVGIITV